MANWHQDPFFQYPLTPFETREGTINLPILYYDNSNFLALYEVDLDKAQTVLNAPALDVVTFSGNKALVAIAIYEYRDTEVGVYNEVGVAIATVPAGTPQPRHPWLAMYQPLDARKLGLTVVDLPVTTAAACAAGKEVWGFPKFVTDISFSLSETDFSSTVKDPKGKDTILTMSGKPGFGIPGPQLDPLLYSRHNGDLIRTLVVTRGGGRVCRPGSIRATVGSSSHAMAQRLRELGVHGKKPKLVFYSHKLQLRLNAGAKVA
ncbi:MAG TPA: acetoacetate decarboxylase family protein [Marinobacter sp.]|nr:acetoacetate decarboxylase family protein [Marinobacter sp.]